MKEALVFAGVVWFIWWNCQRRKPYTHSEWLREMRRRNLGVKKQ
jgi:hypothetical protein